MEGNGVGGYDYGMVVDDGCRTPRHEPCRIPEAVACPPAPRKKRVYTKQQKQRNLPKDGYFQHPDLELFFTMTSKREPYVQVQACLEGGPGSTYY